MNLTDALVPCILGEKPLDQVLNEAQYDFYAAIIQYSFRCEVCGEIIIPDIKVNEHGIFIESNRAEITGGKGNSIHRKVCPDCLNKISLSEIQK